MLITPSFKFLLLKPPSPPSLQLTQTIDSSPQWRSSSVIKPGWRAHDNYDLIYEDKA